jgi:hypothetical protein
MILIFTSLFISVLIYEPDHPVALQFQPVIAEKIQLGKVDQLFKDFLFFYLHHYFLLSNNTQTFES